MKSRATLAVLGLASALAFGMPAAAQDTGFYVGATIGQSKAKSFCDGLAGTGISCDDKDTAWRILGGYQFSRYFAAEFGYADVGGASASLGSLRETIEATLFELVAVGSYPVAERFSIYGKLGLYRGDIEDRTNFGFSADETTTDLTFGFGVRFDFTRNLAARLEWQRYSDVGGGTIGESDIDVMSIGILWKF